MAEDVLVRALRHKVEALRPLRSPRRTFPPLLAQVTHDDFQETISQSESDDRASSVAVEPVHTRAE
ncbi:MAG: hypothetical protein FJ033_09250 [Chloroflexi bacterium]|nr:hypothetical protein [Chloroflexota bacterium]